MLPEARTDEAGRVLAPTEKYSIAVYPGSGTVDGVSGDHITMSPAYIVSDEEVETIVSKVAALVGDYIF